MLDDILVAGWVADADHPLACAPPDGLDEAEAAMVKHPGLEELFGGLVCRRPGGSLPPEGIHGETQCRIVLGICAVTRIKPCIVGAHIGWLGASNNIVRG